MNIAYNIDCMEYMRTLPDNAFDLAVVDPPYGIEKAFSDTSRIQRERPCREQISRPRPEKTQPERRYDVLSDTDNRGRSLWRDGELPAVEETAKSWADHRGRAAEYVAGEWWPAEPNVGRVAYGVPHRVDRLKCLGNAVVPQQFYPVFQAIADIEARLAWNTRAAVEMEGME